MDAFFHDAMGCWLACVENFIGERFVGSCDFLALSADDACLSPSFMVD
jgi:hypothetical protein